MSTLNESLEITIKGDNNNSNLILSSEQSVIGNSKKESLENQLVLIEKQAPNYQTIHSGILRDPESVELIPEDENNKAFLPDSMNTFKNYILQNDYIIEELKFKGKATTYKSDSISNKFFNSFTNEEGLQGLVNSEEDKLFDYTTIAVIMYPKNIKTFSGTIISETGNYWLSGFLYATIEEILRKKHCYIFPCLLKFTLETEISNHFKINPIRYNDLNIPNDILYLDLFSQTTKGSIDYLTNKGYNINNKLGFGKSIGGSMLQSYMNFVHPIVNYFDGFMFDSQIALGGFKIYQESVNNFRAAYRNDLNVPIFRHDCENDFIILLNAVTYNLYTEFLDLLKNINNKARIWVSAGTSHTDNSFYYTTIDNIEYKHYYSTTRQNIGENTIFGAKTEYKTYVSDSPANFIIKSILNSLIKWTKYGILPIQPEGLEVENINNKPVILRDKIGFPKGEIRVAEINVPLRYYSPKSINYPDFDLATQTIPIEKEVLQSLYSSVDDFVKKFTNALQDDIDNGWILKEDKETILKKQTEIAKILLA